MESTVEIICCDLFSAHHELHSPLLPATQTEQAEGAATADSCKHPPHGGGEAAVTTNRRAASNYLLRHLYKEHELTHYAN